MEADWSAVPTDLLLLIGSKIYVCDDRIRFRSVCKSWKRYTVPFPQPPWLVLSEANLCEKHYAVESRQKRNTPVPLQPRGIVGFSEQEIYKLNLPEAHERQIVGSTGTLIITVGKDGLVHLLNPFTRSQIQLPSVKTFVDYDPNRYKKGRVVRDYLVEKIILSSASSTRDCIAMAVHGSSRHLSFARPGDSSWTRCTTPKDWIENLVYYKEKFYVVNNVGTLMVCDVSHNQSSASIVMPEFELLDFENSDIDPEILYTPNCNIFFYLVEWMGELLLVLKFVDTEKLSEYQWDDSEGQPSNKTRCRLERMKRSEETVLYRTKDFQIFKLDFSNSKWDELKNLGEYSLFLGRNTSVSILASYHEGIKKNHIYFTDDCMNLASVGDMSCGRDMGVFDMEKKDMQPHYRGTSTSLYSPPLWLIPDSLAIQK